MELQNGSPVLDREQLRNVTMDDADLMREIVAALIDDTSRQLEKLDRAIRDEDAETCARAAHYSKGACANVGARGAAEILKEIEVNARRSKFGACRSSLDALTAELSRIRVEAETL